MKAHLFFDANGLEMHIGMVLAGTLETILKEASLKNDNKQDKQDKDDAG
ncbi:hypothetical protein GGC63_000496 [Paenibacillus sp. OAS669]|nr:hypothetical protein [Paenibacillus sp. OAS669]